MDIVMYARRGWRRNFLLLGFCCLIGCSTAGRQPQKLDPDDPFSDPFFQEMGEGPGAHAQPAAGAPEPLPDAVRQAVGEDPDVVIPSDEDDEPKSFLEKSSNVFFSIFLVGLSLAKLVALPLLGV